MVDHAPATDLSKYIEQRFFGERPHIRGRRIPIAAIVHFGRENHRSVADLMDDFTLSEPEVLAALLYYSEHKEEVDAQEAAYNAVPVEDWIKYGNDALLLRRDDATPGGE
jgi:uncharacterized protein (DUF433 family)